MTNLMKVSHISVMTILGNTVYDNILLDQFLFVLLIVGIIISLIEFCKTCNALFNSVSSLASVSVRL